MYDKSQTQGVPMDRRRVLRAGLMALGGAALAGLAGGCSLLGIENPNATANQ